MGTFLIQLLLIFSIFYISNFLYQVYKDTCETYDFSKCENNYFFDYALFNNIKSKLKSGDMVLFSAYDHWGVARLKKNIMFQHYAIIVELNGDLYCLECTSDILVKSEDKLKRYGQGIYLTNLEDRILTYPGNIMAASLKTSLSVEQKERLERFAVECTTNKNYGYLSDFKVFLNMYHGVDYDYLNKYTCISFINYVYKQVIECLDKYKYVKPGNLCGHYHNLLLNKKVVWNWPIEIIHEGLHIKNFKNKRPLIYNI